MPCPATLGPTLLLMRPMLIESPNSNGGNMTRLNKYAAITILGAAFGLAACEDQVGLDANANASLSFAANGGSTLLGDPMPPQNPMTVSGHVIAITRVELRLSELELE